MRVPSKILFTSSFRFPLLLVLVVLYFITAFPLEAEAKPTLGKNDKSQRTVSEQPPTTTTESLEAQTRKKFRSSQHTEEPSGRNANELGGGSNLSNVYLSPSHVEVAQGDNREATLPSSPSVSMKNEEKVEVQDDDNEKKAEAVVSSSAPPRVVVDEGKRQEQQQQNPPGDEVISSFHKPSPADSVPNREHSHPENLLHHHELMQPSTNPDAFFQADQTKKTEKLDRDDKHRAVSELAQAQQDKRTQERDRTRRQQQPQQHPAALQEYIDLHGQRVAISTLRTMCQRLKVDHLPFLQKAAGRDVELAVLFAANRLSSVFDSHMAEKRLVSVNDVTCPHGIAIAKSDEASKLYDLVSEAQREMEGARLHLLDLGDAWTITQTKDSDLVEEVVASLGYYSALARIGNSLNQKLAFLRGPGAISNECLEIVRDVAKLVKEIPEGVPNWTHMRVGAEMLLHQCDMEPALSNADL